MAEAPELHEDIPTLRRNYSSLAILIVDTATQLLRELFLQILKTPINTFFKEEHVRKGVEDLYEKGVIRLRERNYLLSHNVDAKRFDLSLLYILLTTFFKKVLRPKNGWTNDPDHNDYSTSGDLMRLRNVRNRYIAHSPNGRINEEEYKQLWEEVKGAILRIANTWLPDQEQSFRKQIDCIKTENIVLYVFSDQLYMHSASASLSHFFAPNFLAEKQNKQKKVSPASPSDELEHLILWSKQENKYTDDTVMPQIYPKLKLSKHPYVSFVGPSFAEGSLLKGTSDDPSSAQLTLTQEQRLQILQKWQKQDTAYTEEIREFILKSCFSCDEPEKEYVSCPSDTEGSPLKGTSDEPSLEPLTLTQEQRLQILHKWQDQDTAYTEEIREFILKSCFSHDEPEKVSSVGPSSAEDDMESIKSRRSPDDKASDDSDDMESIKSRRSPDDKASDSVELTKSGTILADKEIGRLLIWAKKRSSTIFPYEPDFKIPEYVESNVFRISNRNEVIGTAFFLNPFYEVEPLLLTAGHVIARCDEETVLATDGHFCYPASPVGISSIADVGVLRFKRPLFPMSPSRRPISIDLGTETSTHIYVVGCVSGDQIHQIEECLVLPSRDKDDGFIRFQSKLFSEGSFGSPCLVFKNGQYVVKGMLIGREKGTDMPYELIAITFRCVWKGLGLP